MSCDEILRDGVFGSIIINYNRSVSENLLEWLKSATYSEFKQKQEAGLNIGLPIPDFPLNIKGNYSEDEFNKWKQDIDQGKVRSFSDSETMQIIQRSGDPVIANAWLECTKQTLDPGRTGLISYIKPVTSDPNALIYTARYLPTTMTDYPPLVTGGGFQVAGADVPVPIANSQEISIAGIKLLLRRQGNSAVTVVLNTTKGATDATSPAIAPPLPKPSDMGIGVTVGQKPGAYPSYPNGAGYSPQEYYLLYNLTITGPTAGHQLIRQVKYTVTYEETVIAVGNRIKSAKNTEFMSTDVSSRFQYTYEHLEKQDYGGFLAGLERRVTSIRARADFSGQTYDYIWP